MAIITDILDSDLISASNEVINANFDNLNADKIETSYLDTDTTLAANSDVKIATQKAVKAYVDAGGNVNASTTTKGIVEEATQAEVDAQTATGATGARLFINPSLTPIKASTTVMGAVEEATQAEVNAGTAAGATGARLFVNPSTLQIPFTILNKTTDEDRVSTTTYADDATLKFSADATSLYILRFHMKIYVASGADLKWRLNSTGTITSARSSYSTISATTVGTLSFDDATLNNHTQTFLTSSTECIGVTIDAVIKTNSSGTISLQWACITGAGTDTMYAGSYLEYRKVS